MDINILVQRLQNGESYVIHDALGEPHQETRPPTGLSIKAARVIIALDQQLQQANQVMHSLQTQLNELVQQYETLQNSSTAAASTMKKS